MSEGKTSPHEVQELDACFRAEAGALFGYACAVTQGDQALAHDLVQAAFEAAFRDRLPRIETLYRKVPADPLEHAVSSIALDRCWQVVRGLPGQQHAAALLRWGLDMKQHEIAAVLGITEKTVSVHLYRVRRKLLLQLGADYPFDDGAPEGASP